MVALSEIASHALQVGEALADVPTVGALIDRTLNELAQLLESPLVSFTELDFATGRLPHRSVRISRGTVLLSTV